MALSLTLHSVLSLQSINPILASTVLKINPLKFLPLISVPFLPLRSTTMQTAPAFLMPLEGCLSQGEVCFGKTLLCARANLGLAEPKKTFLGLL